MGLMFALALAVFGGYRRLSHRWPVWHRQRLTAPSLAHLRMARCLSQAELARRIGTSQSRLSRIEAGLDDPRYSTLTKISAALGVDLKYFGRGHGHFPGG